MLPLIATSGGVDALIVDDDSEDLLTTDPYAMRITSAELKKSGGRVPRPGVDAKKHAGPAGAGVTISGVRAKLRPPVLKLVIRLFSWSP
jgi:hypothetical protein